MAGARPAVLGRRGVSLLFAIVLLLGAFIAFRRWQIAREAPRAVAPAGPLEALPSGAFLVVEIDVAALRSHPLTRGWLSEPRVIEGLGDVRELCGADPIERVDRVAVAVPSSSDTGFGLVAMGASEPSELLRCAERVIARRGGEPRREEDGAFSVVRDARVPAGARLAARTGGWLYLAEPGYLARAMRAVTGVEPRLADDPDHASLRARLGAGALVGTAVLSGEQRAALLDELRRQKVDGSPLEALRSVGLAVELGEKLRIHALALADAEASARTMATELQREIAAQAQTPLAKLVGYGALLERITVEAEGASVHLRSEQPLEEVLGVLRRVLALQRLVGANPVPGGPRPGGSATSSPWATPPTGAATSVPAQPRPSPAPSGGGLAN